VIGDHIVESESRRCCLGPLVVQGLIGSAHPAIQDSSHGAGIMSSRLLSTFANVHKAVLTLADGLGALVRVSSELCPCGHTRIGFDLWQTDTLGVIKIVI
jgi:hypothetical protein